MVRERGCLKSDEKSTWTFFFFSSRRRHTRFDCDWSSDVCSSDLAGANGRRVVWRHQAGLGRVTIRQQKSQQGKGDQASGSQVEEQSPPIPKQFQLDRKSTRLNSSHSQISYAVFCLKKKKTNKSQLRTQVRSRYLLARLLLRTHASDDHSKSVLPLPWTSRSTVTYAATRRLPSYPHY